MNTISSLNPFIFKSNKKNFDTKQAFATATTGFLTYPMYNGYRVALHNYYSNKPLKHAIKHFLKHETKSVSTFPFIRARYIREMAFFHADNACEEIAKNAIKEKDFLKLGSIFTLSTFISCFEVKQLGYNISKSINPKIFLPLMLRQIGTIGSLSCGKDSKFSNDKLSNLALGYAFGAISTISQNLFLQNLSQTDNLTKKDSNINYIKVPNKQQIGIFFVSSLARTVFAFVSGNLYESIKKY